MNELNELLRKQYRIYRNRMQYIGHHLRWRVLMPWEVREKHGRP